MSARQLRLPAAHLLPLRLPTSSHVCALGIWGPGTLRQCSHWLGTNDCVCFDRARCCEVPRLRLSYDITSGQALEDVAASSAGTTCWSGGSAANAELAVYHTSTAGARTALPLTCRLSVSIAIASERCTTNYMQAAEITPHFPQNLDRRTPATDVVQLHVHEVLSQLPRTLLEQVLCCVCRLTSKQATLETSALKLQGATCAARRQAAISNISHS